MHTARNRIGDLYPNSAKAAILPRVEGIVKKKFTNGSPALPKGAIRPLKVKWTEP
jgi:hypothetical protein